jgi:prepilin-type N-terminal cleavage/methylation domain-containing protein
MQRRPGFTLSEVLLAIAIMVLLAGILMSGSSLVREKGRQSHCISNLRQIGQALAMYRADFADPVYSLPPPGGLQRLYPQYVTDPGIFACPNDHDPATFTTANGRRFRFSYGYDLHFQPIPGSTEPTQNYVWPDVYGRRGEQYPICWDNHHESFGIPFIVLRLDGSVERVKRRLKPGESSSDL